jgi:DNA topoisomerase IB
VYVHGGEPGLRRERRRGEWVIVGLLGEIRATTSSLLGARHGERDRTLALAIRLLDIGLFRVGWDRYARDNGHVGLTTLRRENVTLRGQEVHFDFVAKSGKRRRMTVRDPQSVAALAELKHRRGAPDELLVFRSEHRWRRIHAPDVNNALRCWGEGPYSAKEFRHESSGDISSIAIVPSNERR